MIDVEHVWIPHTAYSGSAFLLKACRSASDVWKAYFASTKTEYPARARERSSMTMVSGPIMQQSIDFLRGMNEKRGPVQVVYKGDSSEVYISATLKEPRSLIPKVFF